VQLYKFFFTTQLFAKQSINSATKKSTHQSNKLKYPIEGCLDNSKERLNLQSLTQDLLRNWDTTYSMSLFPPCKEIEGNQVNRTNNRHIFLDNFYLRPKTKQLAYAFEDQFKNMMTVDSVWFIQKSKRNDGF
jgi:hypothetical protein